MLREKGALLYDEFCVGVEVFIGENHDGKVEEPHISALIIDKPDFATVKAEIEKTRGPLTLRKVRVALTLIEFIGLFKRLSMTLSPRGLGMTDREYLSYD